MPERSTGLLPREECEQERDIIMAKSSLQELYVEQLQDLYDAEQQILSALPKMERAATTPQLREGFAEHRKQTQSQVQRLEQIFQNLNTSSSGGKPCVAMQGIIKEGEELMQRGLEPDVLEAGLVAAAQRVEHYEIAGYGTVRTWAEQLGRSQDVQLLQQTLEEEKQTDAKLTKLAEQSVNKKASSK